MNPAPGTATERDVLAIHQREDRLVELVDGILVEKVMGFEEGHLAVRLGRFLNAFAEDNDLGIVSGADGTMRLMPGLVRIPDLSFVGWDRLPRHECPTEPIPDLVPHLAVEVLSEGNTPAEMRRKLKEYFLAGVVLVWFVYPETRRVEVYTAPDQFTRLQETDTLDGGSLLPGFQLQLKQLFVRLSKQSRVRRRGKRGNGKA